LVPTQHSSPECYVSSLTINASGYIFAGGDPLVGPVGVLRSTDNGGTWQPVDNGLNTGNGINALIATVNGYLFAGSYGDGVFRSSDNGDNWIQVNNRLMAEGARYQAVKPHHQRVEDNAFHLRADESRWIGFSEDDVSKEAEHFRNARSGDSRVDASPRRNVS